MPAIADLDGDGAYELIHQSHSDLSILNGRDGSELWQIDFPPPFARTWWWQTPVVADVDADGRAELVVSVDNLPTEGGPPTYPAIRVYGSEAWAPARPIWNQYTYHVSNIYDDGTVPLRESPDWSAHNGFRAASAAGPGPSPCEKARPTPARSPTPITTPTLALTPTPPLSPTPASTWTAFLPILLRESNKPTRIPSDVVLAVDVSLSMAGEKLEAARSAIVAFVEAVDMPYDQVALVAFHDQAKVLTPLSGDAVTVIRAAAGLTIGSGTRLDAGLNAALTALGEARPGSSRAIVLLTDGLQDKDREAAITAATTAAAAGISVFTVGLGEDVDAELLRAVAGDPSRYYQAHTAAHLKDIYHRIARILPCQGEYYWSRRCR